MQITGGADRYRELHPSPVRRCRRAILRRRSRQSELGALVARVRARERAHDARHRAVGSLALDQRAVPVGHARARRRDVASAPLRHPLARRRAVPADQRAARGHDEPRCGLSVLPLGPRHRARRHDDAHHRRRGRDAARPRAISRASTTRCGWPCCSRCPRIRCIGRRCAGASTGPTSSRICSRTRSFRARSRSACARSVRRSRCCRAAASPSRSSAICAACSTLRDLGELSIAGLHQWIDDAQLELGDLHGLVEATWFRPSTSAAGQSPVTTQSQIANANASSNANPNSPNRQVAIAGAVAGAIIVGGGFGARPLAHDPARRPEPPDSLRVRPPCANGTAGHSSAAGAAQPHARVELRAAHRARRPLLELAAGSARQLPRARRVSGEGRASSSSRSISSPTWPCAIRSTSSWSPRRRRFRSSTSRSCARTSSRTSPPSRPGRSCSNGSTAVRAQAADADHRLSRRARISRLQSEIGYTIRMEPGVQTPEQTLEAALGLVPRLGLAARATSSGTWDSRAASCRAI